MSAIFELKITLRDIKPKIWRRVQVPKEFNFEQLHFALQSVMGWRNYQDYTFHCSNPENKIEKVKFSHPETSAQLMKDSDFKYFSSRDMKIADFFRQKGSQVVYEYDLCDSWEHDVVLEKILPVGPLTSYPKAIAGRRACPPEGE